MASVVGMVTSVVAIAQDAATLTRTEYAASLRATEDSLRAGDIAGARNHAGFLRGARIVDGADDVAICEGPYGGYGGPPAKGADISARTRISFRDAAQGTEIRLTVDGRTITTRIPAGVHDGQKIRLRGRGRVSIGLLR